MTKRKKGGKLSPWVVVVSKMVHKIKQFFYWSDTRTDREKDTMNMVKMEYRTDNNKKIKSLQVSR
jgi:hypothetical protein